MKATCNHENCHNFYCGSFFALYGYKKSSYLILILIHFSNNSYFKLKRLQNNLYLVDTSTYQCYNMKNYIICKKLFVFRNKEGEGHGAF